jgi:hypothetical protein
MPRAGLTVKETVLEFTGGVPGFVTNTLTVRAVAIREAGTVAVNCVAVPVADSVLPSKLTVASTAKPLPLTVRAKDGMPAVVAAGARPVIVNCPAASRANTSTPTAAARRE